MKTIKRIIAVISAIAVCIASVMIYAYATESITTLHHETNVVIYGESTDGTNTAEILSGVGIYTDRAIPAQYMVKDETGKLHSTRLSRTVEKAETEITETGLNGIEIAESIPSVKKVLSEMSVDGKIIYGNEHNYDLDKLDQLTYMQDFKYYVTHYRVIAGAKVEYKNEEVVLENGMIEVTFKGTEIMRSAEKEQFVIIQVDPISEKVYFLTMKYYDPRDGEYTVEFPCTGPYMICQIMDR